MTPSLKQTRELVSAAFEGQVDSQDVPMAMHMHRVAMACPPDHDTVTTAYLHDIVEDTPTTLEDLAENGYPPAVVEAVRLLTHDKKVLSYPEYIDRLCESKNKIALTVKIADQYDNTNPKRWLGMNPHMARALSKKWAGVLPKLEEALRNAG